MQRFRAIITAVVALALAGLPIPAVATHASMIASGADGTMADVAKADVTMPGADHCCPQAENCDQPMKNGCDQSDACAAKCTPLSANVVLGLDVPPLAMPSRVLVVLAERLRTRSHFRQQVLPELKSDDGC